MLGACCAALDISFDEAMLSWPAGVRDTDGVWAKHWYAAVERSTGFQAWRPREEELPERLRPVLEAVQPAYDALYAHRLHV